MVNETETTTKTTIFEKVMKARLNFQNAEIKKSGRNTFQNFTYFELDDIIPTATRICNDLKLFTMTTILETEAIMNIIDWETGENIEFRVALPHFPNETNANKSMQGAGARITYARRYLYLVFLDIVQEDKINKNLGKPKGNVRRSSVKKAKVSVDTVISSEQMHELRGDAGLNIALNNIQAKSDGDITYKDVNRELIRLKNDDVISLSERVGSKKHLDAVLSSS